MNTLSAPCTTSTSTNNNNHTQPPLPPPQPQPQGQPQSPQLPFPLPRPPATYSAPLPLGQYLRLKSMCCFNKSNENKRAHTHTNNCQQPTNNNQQARSMKPVKKNTSQMQPTSKHNFWYDMCGFCSAITSAAATCCVTLRAGLKSAKDIMMPLC